MRLTSTFTITNYWMHPPFQGGGTGSNPVGGAENFDDLCSFDFKVDSMALSKHLTAESTHANVRYDLYDRNMPWKENSVRELAEEIAACLAKGDSNSATRLAFRFVERYDKSDWETRAGITAEPPLTTGSDHYDALLAGIVEFACASHGVVAPAWVNSDSFFLSKWWFVSGVRSLHADALVHSPISLARRGVFVTQDALEYA